MNEEFDEMKYLNYAKRQIEAAMRSLEDDCPASAELHEWAALVALRVQRIPRPGEVLDDYTQRKGER